MHCDQHLVKSLKLKPTSSITPNNFLLLGGEYEWNSFLQYTDRIHANRLNLKSKQNSVSSINQKEIISLIINNLNKFFEIISSRTL